APIRWLLRYQKNTEVVLSEVTSIDPNARIVFGHDGLELHYDFLIVAAGARHSYFGHTDWEARAPGLKSIEDAVELRRRWLMAFERAERATDPADRAANMMFVIIGGGPTGVELAGMAAHHRALRAADGFPAHRHDAGENPSRRGWSSHSSDIPR